MKKRHDEHNEDYDIGRKDDDENDIVELVDFANQFPSGELLQEKILKK